MKNKCKKIVLIIILFCVIASLIFIGVMVILNKNRIDIPSNPDATSMDRAVKAIVSIGQDIDGQVFFESEEIAKEYARIIFTEHMDGFEEWIGYGYDVLLTHYPEYGVWVARIETSEVFIGRMDWFVFQDSDGKILRYYY